MTVSQRIKYANSFLRSSTFKCVAYTGRYTLRCIECDFERSDKIDHIKKLEMKCSCLKIKNLEKSNPIYNFISTDCGYVTFSCKKRGHENRTKFSRIPKECRECRKSEELRILRKKFNDRYTIKHADRGYFYFCCVECNNITKKFKNVKDNIRCICKSHESLTKTLKEINLECKPHGIKFYEYSSMHKKSRAKCVCGVRWLTTPHNVLKGAKCPRCGIKAAKYINENRSVEEKQAIKDKIKRTMLVNHGVEYAQQSAEIRKKSFKKKEYKLGKKTIYVQGYENLALDHLLSTGIKPKDIKVGHEIGTVPYTFKGVNSFYHPDILLTKENTIIEVKSTYTYKCDTARNKAKRRACIKMGYKFRFYIFKGPGEEPCIK